MYIWKKKKLCYLVHNVTRWLIMWLGIFRFKDRWHFVQLNSLNILQKSQKKNVGLIQTDCGKDKGN